MALTADKKTEWMEGRDIVVKGTISAKIYAGALVETQNVMGIFGFFPAADENASDVCGIALESKEAGDNQTLLLRRTGVVKLKASGSSAGWKVGADVYVVDDETVTWDASATTNSVVAGKFVKLDDDPNYVWVRIG